MAKVKHPSPQDVAGLWVDEYFGKNLVTTVPPYTVEYTSTLPQGANSGFVYIDDYYTQTTTEIEEPSILEKYTVSSNVQFRIVDTPGGYSLQLVLDGEVVFKEEIFGCILADKSSRVVNLPIIAAIKKEKERV